MNLCTINVIYYTAAVTILEKEGKLRKTKQGPGRHIRLESRNQAIRKKLSYIHVLTDCKKSRKYTKHQKNIKYRMEKQYGRITTQKLQYLNAQLKKELKVEIMELRNKKKIQERRDT